MKKIYTLLFLFMIFFSCQKTGEPVMPEIFFDETLTGLNTATIRGSYEHNMIPNNIVIIYAESQDMISSVSKEMNVYGNNFEITLTELKTDTKYYFKLRFSSDFNYYETEQQFFVTAEDDGGEEPDDPNPDAVEKPTVVMKTIDDVTQTTAIFRAIVADDGGTDVTSRGFCWNMSSNPTVDDYTINSGSGVGEYYNSISNLAPNTTYYVRAFAENSEGTAYSSQVSFKTNETEEPVNVLTIEVGGVSFVMVEVEGGTFAMGNSGVGSNLDESPVHDVTLSTYYIGETEVTQELWGAVMGDNPSYNVGDNKPVDNISWNKTQEFIELLNYKTGRKFRLPTEAEWEFAARGGNRSNNYKYSGSNSVDIVAWYQDNSNNETKDVKSKMPNELGIYDMSGNVSEWCSDWYGGYIYNSQTNPTGPDWGNEKVVRGGAFSLEDTYCRVSGRSSATSSWNDENYGLRIVMEK